MYKHFIVHLKPIHMQITNSSRHFFWSLTDGCFSFFPADNTASILTKRSGFRRREQPVHRLPVLIVDSGSPALSSTNTLSVRVCDCDSDGVALSCGAVAYTATGLSTGALVAILGCIITLLGKIHTASESEVAHTAMLLERPLWGSVCSLLSGCFFAATVPVSNSPK